MTCAKRFHFRNTWVQNEWWQTANKLTLQDTLHRAKKKWKHLLLTFESSSDRCKYFLKYFGIHFHAESNVIDHIVCENGFVKGAWWMSIFKHTYNVIWRCRKIKSFAWIRYTWIVMKSITWVNSKINDDVFSWNYKRRLI